MIELYEDTYPLLLAPWFAVATLLGLHSALAGSPVTCALAVTLGGAMLILGLPFARSDRTVALLGAGLGALAAGSPFLVLTLLL